jgi:hypothetical protein
MVQFALIDRWEQDHELQLTEAVPVFTVIHVRLFSKLKAKRMRHKSIPRHKHREPPRR